MASSKRKFPGGDVEMQSQKQHLEWLEMAVRTRVSVPRHQSTSQMAELFWESTKHSIEKHPTKPHFGNAEGLRTMDQLDRLEAQVQQLFADQEKADEKLKKSNEKADEAVRKARKVEDELFFHRPMKEVMLTLRRHVLEGRDDPPLRSSTEAKVREAIATRHDVAHGGNVFIDCFILLEMRQKKDIQLEKYEAKFWEMYSPGEGITLEMIQQASHSVIQVYDLRANVRLLKRWKEAQRRNVGHGQKIEEMCGKTVSLWEEWAKGPKTGTPPDIENRVEEIQELYDSFDHEPPGYKKD